MTTETVHIRASSLWRLLDCPLAWYAEHILGHHRPASAAAHIGTSVHHSTAVYDTGRLEGSGVSIDDAADAFVDALHHPEEEVDWGDTSQRDAEKRGLLVHMRYCNDIAPTRQYGAVEHSLAEQAIEVDGIEIVLTGTLDRIRTANNKAGVSDVKTGKNAVNMAGQAITSKHGPQLGVYTLLAKMDPALAEFDLSLPPEIIGLQTTLQARVGTGEIPNAYDSLVGTEEQPGFLQFIAQYFRSGLFPPNPASPLCSERYCAFYNQCIYHT